MSTAAAVPPVRTLAIGLLFVAGFSFLYTIGAFFGAWPSPPLGKLSQLDLYTGMVSAVATLVTYFRRPRE